jgi:WD40 repeat protein
VVLSRPQGENVNGLAIDPAGRLFLSDREGLRIFELPSGAVCPAPRPKLYSPEFALSSNGRLLLVSTSLNQYGALSSWERQPDGSFRVLWEEGPQAFRWFDWPVLSPDGQLAASAERTPGEGMVGVWSALVVRQTAARGPLCQVPLDRPAAELLAIRLTDRGQLLGLTKRGVLVWDARTGQVVTTIRNPVRKMMTALAVHPGSNWLATTGSDGVVRFWETEAFRSGAAFDWKAGPLRSIAFSPDGALAAVGADDGQVVVWDVDL